MVHVVCLKWGNKYSPDYVNKLYGMVHRHLTLPFEFHCMTENASGLNPKVHVLPLPDLGIHGWWYKLYLFNSDFYGLSGDIFFLDLDLVITGPLNDLLTYKPDKFCIAPDKVAGAYNSSVMRFKIGSMGFLWDSFSYQKEAVMAAYHGDQDWIQTLVLAADIYQYPWVVSYKYDCNSRAKLGGGSLGRWFRKHGHFLPRKHAAYPDGARIVLFHGEPNPEDVMYCAYDKYRHAPWISDYWKE